MINLILGKLTKTIIVFILMVQLSSCITYKYFNETKDYQCTDISIDTVKDVYISNDSLIVFRVFGNLEKINTRDFFHCSYKLSNKGILKGVPIYNTGSQYKKVDRLNNSMIIFQEEDFYQKIEKYRFDKEIRRLSFILDSVKSLDSVTTLIIKHEKEIKSFKESALIVKVNGQYCLYYIFYDVQQDCILTCHLKSIQPICRLKNKWKVPCLLLADIVLLPITIPVSIVYKIFID